jgi:glycerol-3-phosphate dehydrogenase
MAEDTVDQAILLGRLPERKCVTERLRIHGYHHNADTFGGLAAYGADAPEVRALIAQDPSYAERIHPRLQPVRGEVHWAVRREMCRTVEDFLSRRTRSLLLDARASIQAAPVVAQEMAVALGRDEAWAAAQVKEFTDLAQGYVLAKGQARAPTDLQERTHQGAGLAAARGCRGDWARGQVRCSH